MTVQIRKHFRFEAAHVLPYHTGKCSRMHGHSYRLEVAVRGPLQNDGPARGMILDFDELERVVRAHAVDALDHRTLNDALDNPTAERIVAWIWERLEPVLPGLDELVLWETANSCATLRRSDTDDAGDR
ncbi:MAG TPA: 6-carboxytetrahydropterin synthase QueD [Candidatus Acidoferrales bacterium]|nr:6-carboxytetrahydropterin synthase QueD [Candidatus Acidoferrales bacterium]